MAGRPASTAWPALAARVADVLGLDFSGMRERDLRHAVASIAAALGMDSADACADHLLHAGWTRELQRQLAAQLTVGESYFFRDPALLDVFALQLLPELIARRRVQGDLRLRLWSAGCSGGEEPYTLAILLRQMLPDIGRWDVSILATDINPAALAKAREGLFSAWSFRGVAPHVRELWFAREAGGRWRIAPAVRGMVRFEEHNLAQPGAPLGVMLHMPLDVVFCRNVLMYFHPQQARQAAQRVAACLAQGGWLAVSPSEACGMHFPDELETVHYGQAVVLRKPDMRAAGRVPQVATAPFEWQAQEPPSAHEPQAVPREQPPARIDPPEMAIRLADAGRLDEALACCDRWLEEDRMDARAHYLRGLILMDRGDFLPAREAFRRCLYLDPRFAAAEAALAGLAQAHPS